MKVFSRYLSAELLRSYVLVALVLTGIFALLTLVDQLDDVGTGDYGVADALLFTLLTIPRQVYELLPIIILLGSVVGLGMLAASNQLVVIRALGASIWRVVRTVVVTAGSTVLVFLILIEWGIPLLEDRAHNLRAVRMATQSTQVGELGFWARDGKQFLNVKSFQYGRIPTDISIYQFSDTDGLLSFLHAERATIQEQDSWLLEDVWRKHIRQPEANPAEHLETLEWNSFVSEEQVGSLSVPPQSLALSDLFQYVTSLRMRGEDADEYDLALWQQLAIPVSAMLMALIAVPVATSTMRSHSTAKRIFQTSALGMLFYLSSVAIGYIGLLAEVNPVMTTFGPLLLLAIASGLLLRKLQ